MKLKVQAKKLGGKISMKSTVNQGTKFTIELIP
jgi:chemotaxis protein histidine kinase CheA